jgi:dynein intermediate chain
MNEPDGLIDIFSLSMQGRPEYTLKCQYEIVKAMFNPHSPKVVIGSTMSGYLLLWDIRAKDEPVAKMMQTMDRS